MNGVKALSDGTVPLRVWLKNASLFTAALPAHEVFEAALQLLTA